MRRLIAILIISIGLNSCGARKHSCPAYSHNDIAEKPIKLDNHG